MMNIRMWGKALQVIPRISKEEWDGLDVISKWLIAVRAAVLVMTFLSAAIAGILAIQAGKFNFWLWLLLVIGLVMAHATNNLVNDYTDFVRGVDQDNYYRAQYGPQPLVHGLMNRRQLIQYAVITGLIAVACGAILIYARGGYTFLLMGLGAFFVLFYTFPLKYIALGEVAVLVVWGPLMVGGGYYVISGEWDWLVVLASLPYALGVTGVIFGKHIDKIEMDRERSIRTLPVLLGDRNSRYTVIGMFLMQYLLVVYLVIANYFTLVALVVFLAIYGMFRILPMFLNPKPEKKPDDYPDVWPNWYVAGAFYHNRQFGMLYLIGLMLNAVLVHLIL
jgi:1,4-dihydroxy-2-naphthoate octaprenyltransferase